jgi:ribosomal protein S18 acetylase RimI-like enzyme
VVSVLARAFQDNPLNRAVFQSTDPKRCRRANIHGMRALLPVANERGLVEVIRSAGDIVGGLVSTPPHNYPLPAPPIVSRLRCLLGQGWSVSVRWAQAFEALDSAHPPEPHWYLSTLGVDPGRQGEGFGSELLRDWLENADRDGAPAFLESDTLENVEFYSRAGFETIGELDILGARIWQMWRKACR